MQAERFLHASKHRRGVSAWFGGDGGGGCGRRDRRPGGEARGTRETGGSAPRLGKRPSRTSYSRTGARGCGPQVVAFQGETCGGAFTEADGNRWGETGDMAKEWKRTETRSETERLRFVYLCFTVLYPPFSIFFLVYSDPRKVLASQVGALNPQVCH